MDIFQTGETPNPSNAVEENNETTQESIQEIEASIKPVEAEKDLNSEDFAQGEAANAEKLLITKNIEMLKEPVQQETGNGVTNSDKHESELKLSNKDSADKESVKTVYTETIEILKEAVQQETSNDKNGDEHESELKVSNRDLANEESAKTVQKETIEILNVELVVPSRSDFVTSAGSDNALTSEVNVNNVNRSDIDMVENIENNQNENDTGIEETQMDTIEVNIVSTATEIEQLDTCCENVENNTELLNTSGLGLLAQYQSDDDTESVVEVPITAGQDYRNQVVEIDSDTDSDGSSGSSDVEYLNKLRKTIEKRIEVADEDDGEDEDQEDGTGKRRHQQRLRVKGEMLLEDLPPIQELQITVPENDCIEFGKIHSIVDQLVLVSALPNSILLDLETVIFLEKGQKVLGEVFDVMGQVADPWYCVRFNSNKQIKEKEIKIGDIVYVAPKTQYTQYVILSNLMKTRGSDASWENDVEPPPRFLDYSDDEQEQLARKQLRNKDRPNDNDDATKRPRTVVSDSTPTSSSYQTNSQHRSRNGERNNRGSPAGQSHMRPRYNGPHQTQQHTPNHYRSSWHSNYSPQNYPAQPTNNFRMHMPQNQVPSLQTFNPNMPAYGMPNTHAMQYPPPQQPPPYGVPTMFHQHSQQLMPNTFSIRSSTLHRPPPHAPYHHQYTSSPPPPPGSQ